jgi:hypothetical protein
MEVDNGAVAGEVSGSGNSGACNRVIARLRKH